MRNPFDDEDMAAYWTSMIRQGSNPFRVYVSDPALFAYLDELTLSGPVLDLGCGEGYLVRYLSERGHQAIGVDLSLALLREAQSAQVKKERFVNADAFHLPFAPASVAQIVSNFLLVELADPAAVIREVGRVLKPGGQFIFEIVHPFCFADNAGTTRGQKVVDYFTSQRFEEKFVINQRESPLASIRYHHPLTVYSQALTENNFCIASMAEPRPTAETPTDHPIWEILREPWFLIIEAVKGSG